MPNKLLYYNPNIVTHSANYDLPGVEKFSRFFHVFNPTAVFVDRTETINIPVRVKSLFPMPKFRTANKTYEEICNERASGLLKRASDVNCDLCVFYSGGIDSTLLLISLLKNSNEAQKKRIKVLLTEDSIAENPNFYKDHIHGKLQTEPSNIFPYLLGNDNIFVGGEHNDQLFGSDVVQKLIAKFGSGVIHKKYDRASFHDFFNESLNNVTTTDLYLDIFEKLKNNAPINISSNFDFLWWINFSLKWQSVFMRMLSRVSQRNVLKISLDYIKNNYFHFYGTEDFQLWSMNNLDKRIRDTWNTYKWVCKDIIYEYTKDADYRDNKTKRGSLHFLFIQQLSFNFIDEYMNFYHEIDRNEYYNPNNDFV